MVSRSRSRALVALAVALAAAPAAAHAEVRNGSFGAGRLKPDDPSMRIVRTHVSYDTAGRLEGTVTAEGPVQDRTVGVVFQVGTYDKRRRCQGTDGQPTGAIAGEVDTFSLPPEPDPNLYGLKAIRLAWLGKDLLGDTGVSYSASGPTATIGAEFGLFAGRPWNCAYTQLYSTQDESAKDDTPDFPLGAKAIAENRRLQKKALKKCGKRGGKAARATCRRKARERFVTPS
jgi:hypothetical protein